MAQSAKYLPAFSSYPGSWDPALHLARSVGNLLLTLPLFLPPPTTTTGALSKSQKKKKIYLGGTYRILVVPAKTKIGPKDPQIKGQVSCKLHVTIQIQGLAYTSGNRIPFTSRICRCFAQIKVPPQSLREHKPQQKIMKKC